MVKEIEKINEELLKLHNSISGKKNTLDEIAKEFMEIRTVQFAENNDGGDFGSYGKRMDNKKQRAYGSLLDYINI